MGCGASTQNCPAAPAFLPVSAGMSMAAAEDSATSPKKQRGSEESAASEVFTERETATPEVDVSQGLPKIELRRTLSADFALTSEEEGEEESSSDGKQSTHGLRSSQSPSFRAERESFEKLPDVPTDLFGLTDSVAASTGGMDGRLKQPSQEDDATVLNVSNDAQQKKGRRRHRREKERKRPAAGEPPAHSSAAEIAAELSR